MAEEQKIENTLTKAVKASDGLCLKFISPGMNGVPDRLVLLPKGKISFVELKAPGKKPRAIQKRRMKQLSRLGFKCFVVDNTDIIDAVIEKTKGDD